MAEEPEQMLPEERPTTVNGEKRRSEVPIQ
jgi:hypothetical protein